MRVKIKKLHKDAVIPSYAKAGDAGLDLTAIGVNILEDIDSNVITYNTGLSIEIPENHVGLIFPRSSIYKKELLLSNSVGVIDSGYRGEIMLKFITYQHSKLIYEVGDRVGQLIILPYPQIEFEEVNELTASHRGNNGFGSSGK